MRDEIECNTINSIDPKENKKDSIIKAIMELCTTSTTYSSSIYYILF